ncbi:hypothetical protein MCOR25_006864 [Pyricularia grisea]|nr:hypothetical protein MCOR25_006864 [Pyricularia grisea]
MSYTPSPTPSADEETLGLPRILCLHGGGVNADIFRLQMRPIITRLSSRFRFVFADGPFICPAHPAIGAVYGNHGPFRRWLRWLPEHPEIDGETASEEIQYQLRTAMEDDNYRGGRGEWVGLLGFSQGAKIAASLLLAQQTLEAAGQTQDCNWKFGVIMAGRAPLVALDERMGYIKGVQDASGIGAEFTDWAGSDDKGHILRIPTIHIHGLKDPGLHLHRKLLDKYCIPEITTLVEWEGDHRLPFKGPDVLAVVDQISIVARSLGILTH